MKKAVFLIVSVVLLTLPMVSYAETAQQRGPNLNNSGLCAESEAEEVGTIDMILASALSDKDQPCYAGGKYMGNCSRLEPYFNVFSGGCYRTLEDCKKADGDLQNPARSSGCVRCGK